MPIRTTESDVRSVIDTDPDITMTAFIRAASLVTDRIAACAIAKEDPLTDAELLEIETWLAAHFYSLRDPLYTSKSTLNASGSFKVDSSYLDMAMLLDHSGCLANLIEGSRSAKAFWLGKRPSEQIDFADRD